MRGNFIDDKCIFQQSQYCKSEIFPQPCDIHLNIKSWPFYTIELWNYVSLRLTVNSFKRFFHVKLPLMLTLTWRSIDILFEKFRNKGFNLKNTPCSLPLRVGISCKTYRLFFVFSGYLHFWSLEFRALLDLPNNSSYLGEI